MHCKYVTWGNFRNPFFKYTEDSIQTDERSQNGVKNWEQSLWSSPASFEVLEVPSQNFRVSETDCQFENSETRDQVFPFCESTISSTFSKRLLIYKVISQNF